MHRDTEEIISWCGRPLEPLAPTKIDGSPVQFYYSERTSSNTKCSDCGSKEDGWLAEQAALKHMQMLGRKSGW